MEVCLEDGLVGLTGKSEVYDEISNDSIDSNEVSVGSQTDSIVSQISENYPASSGEDSDADVGDGYHSHILAAAAVMARQRGYSLEIEEDTEDEEGPEEFIHGEINAIEKSPSEDTTEEIVSGYHAHILAAASTMARQRGYSLDISEEGKEGEGEGVLVCDDEPKSPQSPAMLNNGDLVEDPDEVGHSNDASNASATQQDLETGPSKAVANDTKKANPQEVDTRGPKIEPLTSASNETVNKEIESDPHITLVDHGGEDILIKGAPCVEEKTMEMDIEQGECDETKIEGTSIVNKVVAMEETLEDLDNTPDEEKEQQKETDTSKIDDKIEKVDDDSSPSLKEHEIEEEKADVLSTGESRAIPPYGLESHSNDFVNVDEDKKIDSNDALATALLAGNEFGSEDTDYNKQDEQNEGKKEPSKCNRSSEGKSMGIKNDEESGLDEMGGKTSEELYLPIPLLGDEDADQFENSTSMSDLSESLRHGNDNLEASRKEESGDSFEGMPQSSPLFHDTYLDEECKSEDGSQSINLGLLELKNQEEKEISGEQTSRTQLDDSRSKVEKEPDTQSKRDDSTQSISLGQKEYNLIGANEDEGKREYFDGQEFGRSAEGIRFVRLNDSTGVSTNSIVTEPTDDGDECRELSTMMRSLRQIEKARRVTLMRSDNDSEDDGLWIDLTEGVAPRGGSNGSLSTGDPLEAKENDTKKKKMKKVAKAEWLASVAADEANEELVRSDDDSELVLNNGSVQMGSTMMEDSTSIFDEGSIRNTSISSFRHMKEARDARFRRMNDGSSENSMAGSQSVGTTGSEISSDAEAQKEHSIADIRKLLEEEVSARFQRLSTIDDEVDINEENTLVSGSEKQDDGNSEESSKEEDEIDLEKGQSVDDDEEDESDEDADGRETDTKTRSVLAQLCMPCNGRCIAFKEKLCSRKGYIVSAAILLALLILGNIALIVFLTI